MSKSTKHHRKQFNKLPIRDILKHENFKKVQTISLLAIGVFLIINITTYFVYTKKTYPKSFLNNTNIGNISFDILEQTIQNTAPLPGNINLALGDRKIDALSSDIGISIDYQRTTSSIQRNRFERRQITIGQQTIFSQQVETYQIGVSGKSRITLIRRVAPIGWPKRQQLPYFLPATD